MCFCDISEMRCLYGMRAITKTQKRSCLVPYSFLSVFPMLAESQTSPLSFPGTSGLLLVCFCNEFSIYASYMVSGGKRKLGRHVFSKFLILGDISLVSHLDFK